MVVAVTSRSGLATGSVRRIAIALMGFGLVDVGHRRIG
jgi:hypothetical protein